MLRDLTTEFRTLNTRYHRLHRHSPLNEHLEFTRAQVELWQLAQAICALREPALQSHLDQTRRKIMEELRKLKHGGAAVRVVKYARRMRWYDFQLTPEISIDPGLTGRVTNQRNLNELRRLLCKQRMLISEVTHGCLA